MARHIWSVLCSKTSIDRATNNVSLFETIEQLQVQAPSEKAGKPGFVVFPLELVSLWTRSHKEVAEHTTARLLLQGPDGNALGKTNEISVDLSPTLRARTFVKLGGLPVVGSGDYTFVVEMQGEGDCWTRVAEIPVSVVVSPKGEAPPFIGGSGG